MSATLKYDEPEVENVARGFGLTATFSTGVQGKFSEESALIFVDI